MKTAINYPRFQNMLLVAALMVPFGLIFAQKTYASSNDNLQLQILPLDCVFEIVNDGLNTVQYLTPEKCLQKLPQPSNSQSPQNYPVAGLFRSPNNPGQISNSTGPQRTLGEFASVKQSKSSSKSATIAKGVAAVTVLAAIITFALLLAA